MPADKDSRTEKATPKRRSDARKNGQVARSIEVSSALIILVVFVALKSFGQSIYSDVSNLMQFFLQVPASFELNEQNISSLFLNLSLLFAKIVLPIAAIALVISVIANITQIGFLVTSKPLVPKLNKINPLSGFKRIISGKALVDLIKSSLKIIIVGYLSYSIIISHYDEVINTINMDILDTVGMYASIAYEIGIKTATALLILALVDYIYQRYSFEKSIRMTKQEIKEENKQSEGDPKIKARIKRKQFEMAFSRMMHAVPTADVVITNPIRLAIAIKYDPATMTAPKVVAKGQRLIAEKIRTIANEHNIPIVEDKPLAQSLYKSTEIDQEIPFDLYKAVAEILAYVYQISNKKIGV